MSRRLLILCIAPMLAVCFARAQEDKAPLDLLKKTDMLGLDDGKKIDALPDAERAKTDAAAGGQIETTGTNAPTEITATREATFDEKTHKAVFTGDVHVNDSKFKITCDKLTAFLRPTGAKQPASASPAPKATASSGQRTTPGGGLQRAIAEGNVVIIQDRPAENGGKPQHSIGKAQRADYNADTGDVVLTGWPSVQQGMNNQVATDASTVMIMNRNSNTMHTQGPSKTLIQEEPEQKPTPQPQ